MTNNIILDLLMICKAEAGESIILSSIAHAAKRHWNYPDELIQLWKDDLTITEEYLQDNLILKAIYLDKIVGFAAMEFPSQSSLELIHLWILPDYMGCGIGRILTEHAIEKAAIPGFKKVKVVSDPNAIGFYKKLGFIEVSKVDSKPAGRKLPLLERQL